MKRIAVIGAGSWGTALALVAARAGNKVRLWEYKPELAAALARDRENRFYMPGFPLPDLIEPTSELGRALDGAEVVLSVVPAQACRPVFSSMIPHLKPQMIFVNAAKGIETEGLMRMEEVVGELLRDHFEPRYVALSGPSFALEVARDEPTAIVAASHSSTWAKTAQETLSSGHFRIYSSHDVIGVELGGALKNVMALATGAAHGLGLGYNTTAALVTRGLAEITRLAVRMGGRAETLAGLAGMGDLVLTCFGELSRNRHVGVELGRGRNLSDILGEMREVAEGVKTTRAAWELSQRVGVDMPVTAAVYRMLYEEKSPRDLLFELMDRPLKPERI